MSTKELLRQSFNEARQAKNLTLAAALSVVIGDIQLAESRGKEQTEDQVLDRIRKQIKSNEEVLKYLKADDQRATDLTNENTFLAQFLPSKLQFLAIISVLTEHQYHAKIMEAKSDGQAIGLVMKLLKSLGLDGDSSEVKRVVEAIRGLAKV